MKLFLKIIRFAKQFWKLIVLSILLSFFYVLFNNFSLWISVDFIGELFGSDQAQKSRVESLAPENSDPNVSKPGTAGQLDKYTRAMSKGKGLYDRIKHGVKDLIVRKNKTETLKIVCILIFLSFLIKNIILYSRAIIIFFIQMKIIIKLRILLYNTLLRLPLSFIERRRTGEFISIAFNDVGSVNTVIQNAYGTLIMTPLQVIANIVILFLISWKLTLISFISIPISGILISKIGQSIRRKSRRVFRQNANVVTVFQEALTSLRIVKAFTNEGKEENRFKSENDRFFHLNFRSQKLKELTSPLNEILGAFILVFLLWYGGNLVYTTTILGAEDFTRFLVFLFMLFQPLKTFSGLNNTIQTGLAAAERIFHTLDMQPEVYEKPNAISIDSFNDSIVFENVSFRYDDHLPLVLRDINLEIKKGEMVALVGHSGSGKSTLSDLIPRFYEVTEGRIRIDRIDSKELTLHSLRKQIGIVTQDSILFNDTIQANIGYGLENSNEEKIIEAAKAANAWEFIEEMENGLGTVIGERGIKLSGGQKQRLSIARAILKNPPILILDEATSSLDTESEKLVQDAIDKLMENRTVLVIAHRLSTVTHADKIIVLDRSKIICSGTHIELLQTCPKYKRLYEIQFESVSADVPS
jgi:subfamily B ATP-binding cassette protein MsbA